MANAFNVFYGDQTDAFLVRTMSSKSSFSFVVITRKTFFFSSFLFSLSLFLWERFFFCEEFYCALWMNSCIPKLGGLIFKHKPSTKKKTKRQVSRVECRISATFQVVWEERGEKARIMWFNKNKNRSLSGWSHTTGIFKPTETKYQSSFWWPLLKAFHRPRLHPCEVSRFIEGESTYRRV